MDSETRKGHGGTYLLTWTTYGSWVRGDHRGFVGRVPEDGKTIVHNLPGEPYDAEEPELRQASSARQAGPPVRLSLEHADRCVTAFREVARKYAVTVHAGAIMATHVHLVTTSVDFDGARLLNLFKGVSSRRLGQCFDKPAGGSWWTRHGSRRLLLNQRSVDAAIQYVGDQPFPLILFQEDLSEPRDSSPAPISEPLHSCSAPSTGIQGAPHECGGSEKARDTNVAALNDAHHANVAARSREIRSVVHSIAFVGVLWSAVIASAFPPANSFHRISRTSMNCGDIAAPQVALCTANGDDLGLRIVPNVAEAVLSPSVHTNGQYRLRVGVLAPLTPQYWPPNPQFDCNHNALPDECEGTGPGLLPESPAVLKNRYISLRSSGMSSQNSAIRVTLASLLHPNPPSLAQFPPPNFHAIECGKRWIGPPSDCTESEVQHTTFKCARLQCAPAYVDWDTALGGATLHVTGVEVVPSSVYLVQSIPDGADIADEAAYSTPLAIPTARWGDVVDPFQLPSAALTQPNVLDVAAIVDKFKDLPTAINKARAQLQPASPDPTRPVDIRDIADTVDAFKAFAYPFTIPPSCP
ncbi:MAG: transposase [Planctomycetes bacterium]|nr:transposase [Planctomycetota bacterium]MBI3833675.1 transposase [Planctomycetota bacterium]